MTTRAEVLSVARSWIGTPWVHQQHKKGLGCDCAGFLRGVLMEVGVLPPQSHWHLIDVKKYEGYSRIPDGKSMLAACSELMVRIPFGEVEPGDVLLMRMRRFPQHLAFVGDHRWGKSIIHSINDHGNGKGAVREEFLGPKWVKQVVGGFRVPGVVA